MTRMNDLPRLTRREWLKLATAGVAAYSSSGWLEAMAADTAKNPQRKRSCILLWMTGGPSQMDTFDLKPGHANGGPYKEIQTASPGLKISEHLPKIAEFGNHLAVIRSMQTKEADHGRATYYLRTGYMPQGPIQYPSLGALVSKENGDPMAALPNFVSVAPIRAFNPASFGAGFLGPQFAPLIVGENAGFGQQQRPGQDQIDRSLKVQDLDVPASVEKAHADARMGLLTDMDTEFASRRPGVAPESHRNAYERAVRLMKSEASKAFKLDEEPDALRDAYGRNLFGQGCLLARRLVERGVPFVEVTLANAGQGVFGWDTHNQNFENVKRLSGVLDPAWATLMTDLKQRGLLDSTLIVWMGEFGRTPKIAQDRQGRDHWPNSWSTVLAGGGIKGGQAYGKTSAGGDAVEEHPVAVPDLMATIVKALGINPNKQNNSPEGRPIRIADKTGNPIKEVLV
jgi:hypothetical protein